MKSEDLKESHRQKGKIKTMMYVTWYDKEMNQTYSEWMTGEGLFNLQIDEEVTIISIEEEDK